MGAASLCVRSQAHSDQLSTASRAPASLGSSTPLLRHQAAHSPGTQKSAPLQPSLTPAPGRLSRALAGSRLLWVPRSPAQLHPSCSPHISSLPAPRGHSPSWSHPQEPKQCFCVPSLLPVLISASHLLCFGIPTPHEAPWAGTAPAGQLALRSWARAEPERVQRRVGSNQRLLKPVCPVSTGMEKGRKIKLCGEEGEIQHGFSFVF